MLNLYFPFLFQITRLFALAFAIVAVAVTISAGDDQQDNINATPSVVSRLDPLLKKALLRALSNLEVEHDDSTEDISVETTTNVPRGDELLEESTAADLQALNLYHSYITEGGSNYTQKSRDDNEIIHTIIVKAPKTTVSPVDRVDAKQSDQVIIRFGNPDPVKDSDVHVQTVQIARSVSSNEIGNENEINDDDKVTTYKPRDKSNFITASTTSTTGVPTTTATATTTTPAPTHNNEGENIENVAPNDVKIFQAPLVAAFTVQQDARGQPKTVIPIVHQIDTPSPTAKLVQEFSLAVPTPISTDASNTNAKTIRPTAQPTHSTTPFVLPLTQNNPVNSVNPSPTGSLSQSLELPNTKEATFSTFALEQKRKQLEEQILILQQHQRQQEELFRQQQIYHEQQAFSRQQQLLLQQRLRFEEEARLRQQRFEHEQRLFRQQLLQPRYPSLSQSLSQLPPHLNVPSVQIIPSLSFPPVQIATQQLLPVREASEFGNKGPIEIPAQTLFPPTQTFPQVQAPPLLSTIQQPPLRSAQQFNPQITISASVQPEALIQTPPPQPPQTAQPTHTNIDPTVISADQSQSRNRVFRQESNTANFGFNNNNLNNNFPGSTFFPVFNADNQLQNLLLQSGYSGRSNEELNIISKVLALNHGIGPSNFIGDDSRRFVRSAPPPPLASTSTEN